MGIRKLTVTVATLAILVLRLTAADRRVIETDWTGVRQSLAGTASQGKAFRVVLLDGREFQAVLARVEDDGLVVRSNPATSQWAISAAEARIPRSDVVAVQQKGKRGHGRLIGTLVGVAIMAAAVAAPGKQIDSLADKPVPRGQAAAVGALFIPLGYLVGSAVDKPYPELRPRAKSPLPGK